MKSSELTEMQLLQMHHRRPFFIINILVVSVFNASHFAHFFSNVSTLILAALLRQSDWMENIGCCVSHCSAHNVICLRPTWPAQNRLLVGCSGTRLVVQVKLLYSLRRNVAQWRRWVSRRKVCSEIKSEEEEEEETMNLTMKRTDFAASISIILNRAIPDGLFRWYNIPSIWLFRAHCELI